MRLTVPVIIPAYRPSEALVDLVKALLDLSHSPILVVDDGSGSAYVSIFESIRLSDRVHFLRHAIHLGKGAALKTGMNQVLLQFPEAAGVVTAGADGQHAPDDILRIATRLEENAETLVIGVRTLNDATLRSSVTRVLMNAMVGTPLADNQTGLRAIPAALIPHLLGLASTVHEFELDMLIACRNQCFAIAQEPIRTISTGRRNSSPFHPIFDSMRTYLLLFRFALVSLCTAAIDNLVFVLAMALGGSIGQSLALARAVAMMFNFAGARGFVFHYKQWNAVLVPKYVAVVVGNGLVSYALIQFLGNSFGLATIPAKLLAESTLFLANFALQRDFVFTTRERARTAWDKYYAKVPGTAKLTRKYTTAVLIDAIRTHGEPSGNQGLSLIEIGGANSCFVDHILRDVSCRVYDVFDTNQYGLSLLEKRYSGDVVRLHQQSVLAMAVETPADLVFSVGLVEHFDPEETRQAVLAHFDAVRPGGTVVITFPTPTLLYRIARTCIELIGMWKFHDERPLYPAEVIAAVKERGEVVLRKTLWPLILTQHLIVARKWSESAAVQPTISFTTRPSTSVNLKSRPL